VANFIQDYKASRTKLGRPSSLSAADEILLGLLFLRHNLVDILLAAIFHVPPRLTTNARHRVLDFLYSRLSPQLQWGPLTQRMKEGQELMGLFVTWIVDGSEQPVLASSSKLADAEFFSTKKNQHSINILMVISLSSRILYLSPSYPGSYEDLTLSKVTKEEWRSL